MRVSASARDAWKRRQPMRCQMADRWVPKFGTHFFFRLFIYFFVAIRPTLSNEYIFVPNFRLPKILKKRRDVFFPGNMTIVRQKWAVQQIIHAHDSLENYGVLEYIIVFIWLRNWDFDILKSTRRLLKDLYRVSKTFTLSKAWMDWKAD